MKTIVCYGDSNTWGHRSYRVRQTNPALMRFPWGVRWTSLLQQKLGQDYRVEECGLNGRTTMFDDPLAEDRNGLASINVTLQMHYPVDMVIIMLGTNDVKEFFGMPPYIIARGAGRIIEKITGMTAGAFLHERMFNPMQFRGHAWGVCPKGHTIGGSGLFLRTKDLARYCYMLACGGEFEGRQILTPKWIEKARGEKGGYGYGFHNSGDGRWFATYGMYAQCGFVFPSTRSALAIHGHDVIRDEIESKIIPQYL